MRSESSGAGRFGVLEFVFGVVQNRDVRRHLEDSVEESDGADFDPNADSDEPTFEYAELNYVGKWELEKKDLQPWRYVATRQERPECLALNADEMQAPSGKTMQTRVYVSNLSPEKHEARTVVCEAHTRCGQGEEVHAIMKQDWAGGMLPSNCFEANDLWRQLVALTHNMTALLRRTCLPAVWWHVRMKKLRSLFLMKGSRLVRHARQWTLNIYEKSADLFRQAWEQILLLPLMGSSWAVAAK